ncbi:MAG: YlbF family regulator [Bacillota bacterium]
MSIMEKAEDLGKALVESSEFTEMKAAEQKIEENEDAKALLDEFEAEQKKLQMMQQNGQQITPEQQKNLQSVQAKMQKNEQIKEYMDAQQKFNKVMNSVNQVITSQLQDEEE